MAAEKDIYIKLSEKIGVVGYPRYIEILGERADAGRGGVCNRPGRGNAPEQLMKKLNIDEKALATRTLDMQRRGFVRKTREGTYAIPQMPRFFPRINDTPKLKELWFDFFHSGDYIEIDVAHMKARAQDPPGNTFAQNHTCPPGPFWPAQYPQRAILWYEDMEQIFQRSQSISQGGFNNQDGTLGTRDGCGCRRYWGTCDSPGGCTGWEWKEGVWGQRIRAGLPFGARNLVTFEQALAACDTMENYGLIHMSPNTAR